MQFQNVDLNQKHIFNPRLHPKLYVNKIYSIHIILSEEPSFKFHESKDNIIIHCVSHFPYSFFHFKNQIMRPNCGTMYVNHLCTSHKMKHSTFYY